MYQTVDKIAKAIIKILVVIGAVLISIGTLLAFMQTVLRYCFGISYDWAEESIRYVMLMATFLLAGPVYYNGGNVNMTVVVTKIKNKTVIKLLDMINSVIGCVLALVLAKWGFDLFMSSGGMRTLSMYFPQRLPYSILPIGMVIMVVFCILKLLSTISKTDSDETQSEDTASETGGLN